MSIENDPLDERWFLIDDEKWAALHERLDQPAKASPRLAALLEASSFGTDEARALRASVSDERVARVLERMKELDAECEDDA